MNKCLHCHLLDSLRLWLDRHSQKLDDREVMEHTHRFFVEVLQSLECNAAYDAIIVNIIGRVDQPADKKEMN